MTSMENPTRAWTSASSGESREPRAARGDGSRRRLGWRQITVYAILVTLILLVFMNIALTFYIMTVLRFSIDGIGPIRIVEGGIRLSGRAFLTSQLLTSSIGSPIGSPLTLLSHNNLTVAVRGDDHELLAGLLFERSGFEVIAESFHITDSQGRSLLSARGGEVRLGADTLRVTGEGGVSVDTSIQTPLLRADTGQGLELTSTTRSLNMKAPQSVLIESSASGVTVNTLQDIRLTSTFGSIQLDAQNVYIHNLTAAKPATVTQMQKLRRFEHDIYQLCTCADGQLFLASPDGICQTLPGDVCRQ